MRAAPLIALALLVTCRPPPPPCSPSLQTDSSHCGRCGNVCAAGSRCEAGVCTATCDGLACGAACVHPMSDPQHCGGCGRVCASQHSPPACAAGSCTHGPCERGWADCDGDRTNGCELRSDSCLVNACGIDDAGSAHPCSVVALSADARRVLVYSSALLDPTDPGPGNLFLLDRDAGSFRRVDGLGDAGRHDAGYLTRAALSGDGNTAAFIFAAFGETLPFGGVVSLLIRDLPSGAVRRLTLSDADGGSPFSAGSLSVTYDGGLVAWSQLSDGTNTLGRLYDRATEVSRLFPAEELRVSPDGRKVAFTFGSQAFVSEVGSDAGRRLLPFRSPEQTFGPLEQLPELSFDGHIAAFVSTRTAYFEPGFDAGDTFSSPRIFVASEDGGLLATYAGRFPSLSYDGTRLGYVVERGCVVVEVSTGRVLFDTRDWFGTNVQLCSVSVSGDGRTVGVNVSNSGGRLHELP